VKRRFKVSIEGKTFMVEVEEVGIAPSTPVSEVLRPSVTPIIERRELKIEPKTPMMEATGGEGVVRAPIPGTITSIKCKVGDKVKVGDVLLVLEAMKMENEIYAPKPGVVKRIAVSEGQSVKSDDVLVVIG